MEDEGNRVGRDAGDGYIASNALPQTSHCSLGAKIFQSEGPRFQLEIRTLGHGHLSPFEDLQIPKITLSHAPHPFFLSIPGPAIPTPTIVPPDDLDPWRCSACDGGLRHPSLRQLSERDNPILHSHVL